jgi:hypothetical protein
LGLHRPAIYKWRNEDPEFRDAWEAALDLGIDAMEDEAKRRAMASSDLLMIFLLKANRPDKYRDHSTVDINQTTRVSLDSLSVEDLRARLTQLRVAQDGALAQPVPADRILIGDKVIDLETARDPPPD